jgi:hypothetical protein
VAQYKLLVVRQRADGSLGCSRPCIECNKWITCAKMVGLDLKVYHIDEDGEIISYNGVYGKYKPTDTFW